MKGRRLIGFCTSAALHVGGLLLLLVIAGAGARSEILIDLASDAVGDARSVPGVDLRPRPQPARPEAPASAPAPRVARPADATRRVAPSERATAVMSAGQPPGDEVPATPTPHDPPPSVSMSPAPIPVTPPPPASATLGLVEPAAPADPARGGGPRTATASPGPGSPRVAGPFGSAETSGGGSGRGTVGATAARAASGDGRGGLPAEYAPYLQRFRRRVAEAVHYPLAARRQGLAGTVELEVLLDPSGRVVEARVIASSSHAVLDEAAIDTVKGVPAEPFPDGLPRRPVRVRLPLAFELQ